MYNNAIGVIYQLADILEFGIDKLLEFDIECVQIQCFNPELLTKENADKVKNILKDKIRISSFWAGWSGPKIWDNLDGPVTLGIVPPVYRFERMKELMKGADFAYWLGVEDVTTHAGFIPEQPSLPEYRGVVQAINHISTYCRGKGLHFNFETGQETPITLMRLIADVGHDSLGINLDPANLILYGKGNPIDALDIFNNRIRGVHIKDADYTTDYYKLGNEKVVGQGMVNYPVFLPKLLKQGYKGDLYIEREIKGEQQTIDIKNTITYVKNIMKSCDSI